jgi:3-isopropylmalate/(R)-2-methylmalate dehydratase large subunit
VWKTLRTDADAKFDEEINFEASDIEPMITWN